MRFNRIYQLSDSPRVYFSCGSKFWYKLEGHGSKKSYLLTHPMWFFSFTSLRPFLKHKKELKRKNIELIILNNSRIEHLFSKIFGFKSYLINQNLHVNEHIFKPLDTEKKYDCVYTAQAKPFKRIHLAEKIRSLYIITICKGIHRNQDGSYNIGLYEPRVKHAKCNKTRLSSVEVNQILNESRCGLALSAKEGAMLAFVEYLLAGIPVVTTKSVGGRHLYYHKDFIKIVEPNSNNVEAAVKKVMSKNIEPNYIRNETLKKINKERFKFYKLFIELSNASNNESYEDFYNRIWGNANAIEKFCIHDVEDNYTPVSHG